MSRLRQIYWIDQDRFEDKPDKSTWIETAEVLAGLGYQVDILTSGRRADETLGEGVRLRYFTAFDRLWLFRYTLLLNILIWVLRHSSPDDLIIVHPDGLILTPLLRLFGRRNIHLDVRTVPVELNSFKKRLDRWLFWSLPMRYLRGFASGYSFITDRLRRAVEEEFATCFDDFALWTSGVNTRLFRPMQGDAAHGGCDFLVFYHGTISEKRGIGRVIEAMADIKCRFKDRIQFVLYGHGPGYVALRELADRLDLSDVVHFEGMHPYATMPSKIAQADVCICPLPDRPEWNVSSPIKVFEYMASGKPMILTPIPAHLDVAEGQGFVVWTDGDRPEDFASAILAAFDNRDNLRDAAEGASTMAQERFEWRIQGGRLADYLQKTFAAASHGEQSEGR